MYEMSKMTLEQEEVRNQEYNEYVEQMTPKHNLWANMGKAFLLGGGICLLGQIILQIAAGVFGLKAEDAALWCSLLLVLLSVILTSCNVYGILANWGGAGALVPITGFANGVCASAVEFQKEGQVFGIGCQIFKIAGPEFFQAGCWDLFTGYFKFAGELRGPSHRENLCFSVYSFSILHILP